MTQDRNPLTINSRLSVLRKKLARVNSSWQIEDYHALVKFYISILPELMQVERCTVFILELGSKKICSIFGTGLEHHQIEPPLEGSIVGQVISTGTSCLINDLREHPGYHSIIAQQTGFTCNNLLCAPIKSLTGNSVSGAVQLLNSRQQKGFTSDDLLRLEEIAGFLSLSIESIVLNQEILRLANSLGNEADKLESGNTFPSLIAESPAMLEVLDLVRTVARSPVNVLIQGENGTGKELIARMVHQLSNRQEQTFLPINCAAIPENLFESQFFGHEKGAFTGAEASKSGIFEESSGGTLFLDEIGEMPLLVQPKILRALQEEEGSRVGGQQLIRYDLRLISATNRDLAEEVRNNNFREDLFFRLFSVEIVLPPLRERIEDIIPLCNHFLEMSNRRLGKSILGFSPEVLALFEAYPWPGNVRQLQKEIERLVALTEDDRILMPQQLSRDLLAFNHSQQAAGEESVSSSLALPERVKKLEISLITRALQKTAGNKTKAAALLQITRQGLDKKMKRYELSRPNR